MKVGQRTLRRRRGADWVARGGGGWCFMCAPDAARVLGLRGLGPAVVSVYDAKPRCQARSVLIRLDRGPLLCWRFWDSRAQEWRRMTDSLDRTLDELFPNKPYDTPFTVWVSVKPAAGRKKA